MKKRAALLLFLGLSQMAGDLLRLPCLEGLGTASAASPAPKVFCSRDGYEAYATRFFLEWVDRKDDFHSRPLTADAAGRLKGPYNRRNVYGAVLAFGPILPERLCSPVMAFGFTGDAPVLRELGVDPGSVRSAWIRYEPMSGGDPRFACRRGPGVP